MRQRIPNGEGKQRAYHLEHHQQPIQSVLAYRTSQQDGKVDDGEIVTAHHAVLGLLAADQPQRAEHREAHPTQQVEVTHTELGFATVQQVRPGVVLGQPVARARNEAEQLRHRVDKVDDLRDEEQQHGFAKVAQDADHGERHAGQVVERVADKHLRGVAGRGERKGNFLFKSRLKIIICS